MSQDLAIKNLAHGTREQYLRCCCGFSRYEDFHAHVVFAMTPYPAESCAVGASAALLSVKRRLLVLARTPVDGTGFDPAQAP